MIADVEAGKAPELPQIVIDTDVAVDAAGYENPYARPRPWLPCEIATKVADIDVKGRFMVQDPEKYIPIVASAHEMLQQQPDWQLKQEKSKRPMTVFSEHHHGKEGETSAKQILAKPE